MFLQCIQFTVWVLSVLFWKSKPHFNLKKMPRTIMLSINRNSRICCVFPTIHHVESSPYWGCINNRRINAIESLW